MDIFRAAGGWLSEHWDLLAGHPFIFLDFGLIEAGIILLILSLLYKDKLKKLPNLAEIEDNLRKAQEDCVRLSKENQDLRNETEHLKNEIITLQEDKELLTGMTLPHIKETIGSKMGKALKTL